MKKLSTWLPILFLISAPWLAIAEQFVLFDKHGSQIEAYDKIVQSLRKGDRIVFSDGVEYLILNILGNGNTTKILEVENGKALRIPLKKGRFINQIGQEGLLYREYIDEFEKGWRSTNSKGVRIVHLYPNEYKAGERVVVEAINVGFTLEDFLWNRNTLNLDSEAIEAVNKQVIEWFSSTFRFTYLGDFNESQVLYDLKTQKFILGDITGHNIDVVSFMIRNKIQHFPIENILVSEDLTRMYPRELENQIFEGINAARKSWAGDSENICNLLLK